MSKSIILLFLLLFAVSSICNAQQTVDPNKSSWGIIGSSLRLLNCPEGDGDLPGGNYIWIIVKDTNDDPIVGLPATDIWFEAAPPIKYSGICFCADMPVTDAPTGSDGYTQVRYNHLSCGGCATNGLKCIVANPAGGPPVQILNPPVVASIKFISCDINADLRVDLSDLAIFGLSYNKTVGQLYYDDCCDFVGIGLVNISDLGVLGEHWQHRCPE